MEHDAELLPSELLQVDARDVDARDAATETVILLEGELDIRSTDWFGACVGTVLEKHRASIAIDRFAGPALRGVARNRAVIIVPASGKVPWYLQRCSPGATERLARFGAARIRRQQQAAAVER